MEKICKHHGLTLFSLRSTGYYRCRKCSVDAVNQSRRKMKLKAIEYKGSTCAHCNQPNHPAVFDFHHTDPTLKDFSISADGSTRSWERIKAELDKCIMLCSNCHRIEHARLDDC